MTPILILFFFPKVPQMDELVSVVREKGSK